MTGVRFADLAVGQSLEFVVEHSERGARAADVCALAPTPAR